MRPIIEPRDPDHRVRPRRYLRDFWRYRESKSGAILFAAAGEEALQFSGLTYLLPLSCGTVTSTCSFEELPPLSVHVMVIV
jgi:hypothetical protein